MTLPDPTSSTQEVLLDLIKGKIVQEYQYPMNSFRDVISRLKNKYGLQLRHRDIEGKTRFGAVRKFRRHYLLSVDRKKAEKVYKKICA